MVNRDRSNWVGLTVGVICFSTAPVCAQIIPDHSLNHQNSIVTPKVTVQDALADLIEGGAIRGNNLFHSFSEFNVGEGGRVYFANPDGIANILTRVTGNNISEIFGTLGVDGAANLFLLNPNGIVFGKNAALDVNGSFFATTAESYIFGNGLEFSATNPETAPLLTINLTPGLQMGSNSGSITVQDEGHLIAGGLMFPALDNLGASGLAVKTGQTLGLIGKEINLDGGILKAPGGNIQLLGVETGIVQLKHNLQSWQFDTSLVQSLGDINLFNRALVDTSGILTGNIELKAKNITLNDDSIIAIENFGELPSGKITLEATDTIELTGSSQQSQSNNLLKPTLLITESLGNGKAGDIFVSGKNLFLANGGSITTRSFGNGDGGNINLDIDELIDLKVNSKIFPTYIGTTIFAGGNAGEVHVSARDINFLDGGMIGSNNFGSGSGGVVRINVTEDLKIANSSSKSDNFDFLTSISSSALRTGNSGNLIVNAARLSLENGGVITTSSVAEGNAGTLNINASEYINVIGTTSKSIPINTAIGSNVVIFDQFAREFFGLPDVPSGNAGNITIDTPSLTVTNGGSVSVSNEGLGNGGNIKINSDRIFLDSQASINAFSASGQGGNIALNLQDSLLLRNGSAITAEATGIFASDRYNIDGGNITIGADLVTLLENSSINADAFQGNGGNINITTQGLFLSPDSLISASSEYGLDGKVEIEEVNGDRSFNLDQLPQQPLDATQRIAQSCSTTANNNFAIIGIGGLPDNPLQNLRSTMLWDDLRLADSQIQPEQDLPLNNHSEFNHFNNQAILVEAQQWQLNERGNVVLVANSSLNNSVNPWNNYHNCFNQTN